MFLHFFLLLQVLSSATTTLTEQQSSIEYENVCQLHNETIMCSCDNYSIQDAKMVTCYTTDRLGQLNTPGLSQALSRGEKAITIVFTSALESPLSFVPLTGLGSSLTSLVNFKLMEANLGVLKSHSLSDFPQLEKVELVRNNIEEIEDQAFFNLTKLSVLSLAENKLTFLRPSYFQNCTNLTELYLDRNRISFIQDFTFAHLTKLTDLVLSSNYIEKLNTNIFVGLGNLLHLDMFRNEVLRLTNDVFANLSELQELDLKENMIESIEPHAFRGLATLRVLRLNQNRLKSLVGPLFHDSKLLRLLDLDDNKLESVSREVIFDLEQAKDEFFIAKIQENPWICSCEILWIAVLGRTTQNKIFSKELNHTQCEVKDDSQFGLHLADKVRISFFATQESVMNTCANMEFSLGLSKYLAQVSAKGKPGKATTRDVAQEIRTESQDSPSVERETNKVNEVQVTTSLEEQSTSEPPNTAGNSVDGPNGAKPLLVSNTVIVNLLLSIGFSTLLLFAMQ